jgi:hypothetical protein
MDTDSPQGIGLDSAQARIARMLDPRDDNWSPENMGEREGGTDGAHDAADDDHGDGDNREAGADGMDGGEQPRFLVRVDGEEHEVSLDELVHGYSRQADYTRKTRKLAEERQALTARRTQLADAERERAEYTRLLGELRQSLEAPQEEPEWDRLLPEDATKAAALKHAWQGQQLARERRALAARSEQERVLALAQEAQQQALHRHVQAETARLPDVIPAWRDAAVAQAERQQIVEWAMAQGLSAQDIAGVTRADVVEILRKAWLYDTGRKKAEAAVSVAQPTLRPGTARRGTPDLARQKARLAKSGRVADAARIIEALI